MSGEMKNPPDCPLRSTQFKNLVCSAGVNFYSVGTHAELCHQCEVPSAGIADLLACPHSEIYTYLESDRSEQTVVRYEVDCFAKPEDQHCTQCPNVRDKELVSVSPARYEDG